MIPLVSFTSKKHGVECASVKKEGRKVEAQTKFRRRDKTDIKFKT